MTMVCETYEVSETTTDGKCVAEVADEQVRLIEELALTGQQELIAGDDGEDEDRTIMPYRRMTEEEAIVYGALCPSKSSVEKFASHVIPLRVLQVIAHARALNFFSRLEVWHPTDEMLDPVLVGRTGDNYSGKRYILARWGSELRPFAELREAAAERLKTKRVAEFERIAAEVASDLAAARARPTHAHLIESMPYYNGR